MGGLHGGLQGGIKEELAKVDEGAQRAPHVGIFKEIAVAEEEISVAVVEIEEVEEVVGGDMRTSLNMEETFIPRVASLSNHQTPTSRSRRMPWFAGGRKYL